LLFFGSLLGFLAYSWLLNNVSTTLAGTHAYVNPMVALLVGWLLGGETVRLPMLGGMAVILVGVALVRSGERRQARPAAAAVPLLPAPGPAATPTAERPPIPAPATHGA
jgi:drug/metabolite transporter (DMT)-like permease